MLGTVSLLVVTGFYGLLRVVTGCYGFLRVFTGFENFASLVFGGFNWTCLACCRRKRSACIMSPYRVLTERSCRAVACSKRGQLFILVFEDVYKSVSRNPENDKSREAKYWFTEVGISRLFINS